MEKFIQIFTTFPKKSEATKLADALLKKKLASCIQIVGPIESTYNWKGKKENSKEWLCIIKSRKTLYGKIEKFIAANHSYDLPEITYTEISGHKDYLEWIKKETGKN